MTTLLAEELKAKFGLAGRRAFVPKHKTIRFVAPALKEEEKRFYDKWIVRNSTEQEEIATYEQGSHQWKYSRRYRITGSKFAAAVGHSDYETPDQVVDEMLVSTFQGNAATRRGNKLEPKACAYLLERERRTVNLELELAKQEGRSFIRYAHREFPIPAHFSGEALTIRHRGLVICPDAPWIAASSDGEIYLFGQRIGVAEYKCPKSNRFYPLTPAYYFDQIQGNMHIAKVGFCLLGVYTTQPDKPMLVEHIEYDKEYCEEFLMPSLNQFWFQKVLPRALEFEAALALKAATTATAQSALPDTSCFQQLTLPFVRASVADSKKKPIGSSTRKRKVSSEKPPKTEPTRRRFKRPSFLT